MLQSENTHLNPGIKVIYDTEATSTSSTKLHRQEVCGYLRSLSLPVISTAGKAPVTLDGTELTLESNSGLFNDVLNVLGKVNNIVMCSASTIIGITASEETEFARVACKKYVEYLGKNQPVDLVLANKRIYLQTRNLNDEIIDFERKKIVGWILNQNDTQRLFDLYEQRDQLKGKIRNNNELLMAEKMHNGQGAYRSIHINDNNTHILQFHAGQTVFGKSCSKCGSPMTLQWKQGLLPVAMSDFFWGCIGNHEGVRHIERFKQVDMDLFTRVNRTEFECSSKELSKILTMYGPEQTLINRLSIVKHQATDIYLCPVHNEPMKLRENKDANGLMRRFFFGCPRWSHVYGGCSHVVKLKSPAQLLSAFEAYYGCGLL